MGRFRKPLCLQEYPGFESLPLRQEEFFMKRVFIIHGWDGYPEEGWFPWLKKELEANGFEVFVPQMPDTSSPRIEKWIPALAEVVGRVDEQTYFVGHSMGCQAILRYLETINKPIGGAVFVAGWFNLENLEDEESRELSKPWIEIPINLEKVKQVLPKSILVISNNDPYNAFEDNKKKFIELGSEIVVLENAGHITGDDGFKEIPTVVEQFKTQFI
jgi:uncharacterized protein